MKVSIQLLVAMCGLLTLPVAAEIPLHVETQTYPLEAANEALNDLRRGHIRGAKVLTISS